MTTPAAGWYHDPNDSDSWRWWDGLTWTGHVRPKVETSPVMVAPPMSQPVAIQTQPVSQPVAIQQQPEPVSQPVAIQPAGLPQPGSPVLPAPQTATQLSMTPETPASEQEYWHSPNAEVVPIPGRTSTMAAGNFHTTGSGGFGSSAYAMHEWGDVGSPQTPGIWLLASLPIMSLVIQAGFAVVLGIIQGTTGVSVTPPNLIFYAIIIVLGWVFAGLDVRALRLRGYQPAAIWWMLLLPPLVYFIKRGRVVRREGQRAWPPELLYFLSILGGFIIAGLLVVAALSALGGLGALGLPL